MLRFATPGLGLTVLTVLATPSQASIHLDFGGSTLTATAGIDSAAEAAGAVTDATYTKVSVGSSASSTTAAGLTLTFGTAVSEADMTINYGGTVKDVSRDASNPLTTSKPIMRDVIVRESGADLAIGMRIQGLTNGVYDFYITSFLDNGAAAIENDFDFSVRATTSDSVVTNFSGVTSKTILNTATNRTSGNFVEDDNYVVHRLTISDDASDAYLFVVGLRSGTDPFGGGDPYIGVINSLEIVAVPEPASMLLCGLGTLMILGGRRGHR